MSLPGMKLLCAMALLTAVGAQAAEPQKIDPAKASLLEIRDCMRHNLAERGALRDLGVVSTDREGKPHAMKLRVLWKPSKTDGSARMNMRVLEPASLKGTSYLLLDTPEGENVYFYLPAAKKVQQVIGKGVSRPLWGTDFNYTDLKQVQGFVIAGDTKRNADAEVSKRKAYVLETATKADTTGYTKIVSYIDQASCVLLKSEFYVKGDKPQKVMDADVSTLVNADDYWYVLAYTMKNLVQNTKTVLTLSELSLFEGSYEKTFDPAKFYEEQE